MIAHVAALIGSFVLFANTASAATCGQPLTTGPEPTVSDCLTILRHAAAVSTEDCNPECICDVDASSVVGSSDALICLLGTTGIAVARDCPCPPREPELWPFDARSPWNHPLGSGATFAAEDDPRTVEIRAGDSGLNTRFFSHPIFLASDTDPLETVSVISAAIPDATYRIPVDAQPATGSDAHMHVIDPARAVVHETFDTSREFDGSWEAGVYKDVDLRGSGISPEVGVNIGTRAYGGSAIGGLIRDWELLEAGVIQHALAISLAEGQLRAGPVWPATTEDPPEIYLGSNPMGTLLAIKPDVDLDALGLSPEGLIVARALQDYGAYVVDTGARGPVFYAEPTLPEAIADVIRADLSLLRDLLFLVTNNAADNVGGGGTMRVPLAPPFTDD